MESYGHGDEGEGEGEGFLALLGCGHEWVGVSVKERTVGLRMWREDSWDIKKWGVWLLRGRAGFSD